MDNPGAVELARIQLGLNIGFHILLPALTIALAWILVCLRVRHLRTGDPGWLTA